MKTRPRWMVARDVKEEESLWFRGGANLGFHFDFDNDDDDDDDDVDDGDVDENDIVDNLSGSRTGEICPPALTPLEALTPDQTNVIGFSEGTKVYFVCFVLLHLYSVLFHIA